MQKKENPALTGRARNLRRKMTKQERRLWYDHLRESPFRFYRQRVMGRYIVDFYCPRAKLVVELDGSGHYKEEAKAADAERTAYLEGFGVTVLRISNYDIDTDFEGACLYVDRTVRSLIAANDLSAE